jgi:hypothetical protein
LPRVEYADAFARDLDHDVQYLKAIDEPSWLETLEEDLTELEALLEHFPLAGLEQQREGSQVMLKMRTRRAPFYVWYIFDSPAGPDGIVTFLRLFHTRQRTPELHFP